MGKRKKRADGEGCVFRKRADLWGAYIEMPTMQREAMDRLNQEFFILEEKDQDATPHPPFAHLE